MPLVVDVEKEKENILYSFQDCCKDKPIMNVSMRDVAKQAHMSHQKILYYFHSKDELLLSYVSHFFNVYGKIELMNLDDKVASNKKDIMHLMVDYFYDMDQDNSYNRIFTQIFILAYYNPDIQLIKDKVYQEWKSYIERVFIVKGIEYNKEDIDALLVLSDGILVNNTNNELSRKNAHKIVDALLK